jgi:hypothetical protein
MFLRYLESGLGIFPVNGKTAFIKGWEEWCLKLPTIEEATLWDELYKDYNIAMPCGPASGVMWLDIDSDNLEVLRL